MSSTIITLNVGGKIFTTLRSTLTDRSPYFAALLSDRWNGSPCQIEGNLFVDADPAMFDHILNYLRRSVPPIFWTRQGGFDHPLYAALQQEARYFGLNSLAEWIAEQRYMESIVITESIEVQDLVHCLQGNLRQHSERSEKHFDYAQYESKGGVKRKQIHVRTTSFRAPVSLFGRHCDLETS